jgi:hypothetical protein
MSQHRVRHAAAEWDAVLLEGTAVLHYLADEIQIQSRARR